MTDMRDKLQESKYFLTRMKDTRGERDAFRYHVSAFLAAADSIVDIMKTEFCKSVGFTPWRHQKEREIGNDLKYFRKQRDRTLHVRALKTSATITVNLRETIGVSTAPKIIHYIAGTGGPVVLAKSDSPQPSSDKSQSATDWDWFFEDRDREPLIPLCEAYLAKLEIILDECESKFTPRPTSGIQ